MQRPLVALIAAAGLAWLVFVLSSGDRSGASPGPAPSDAGRAGADAVSAHAPHEPSAPPPAPAPAANGAPTAQAAPAETEVEGAGSDLDRPGEGLSLTGLRRRNAFHAEARLDAWANAEEERLSRVLAGLEVVQGRYGGAECRTSLCRLTFTFEQEAALADNQGLFDDLRRTFGMDLAAERHPLPTGQLRVSLYVAGDDR